jgi:DNA topoisomerase IB
VLTAAILASEEEGLTSVTSRKRVVSTVVKEVAQALGNTPAVCRASYVDPRVIDRFLNGETIDLPRGRDLTDDRVRAEVERAVLDLLDPDDRQRAAA